MTISIDSKQTCPIWPDCDCSPERDCAAFSFTASPGTGGPARASDQASPAPRAIDPDEAVSELRKAMATPSATLKQRAEQILTDMRAILARSDDALWMVKRELGHRADLLDDAFSAHVDMGFVSRDLRELIRSL